MFINKSVTTLFRILYALNYNCYIFHVCKHAERTEVVHKGRPAWTSGLPVPAI